MPAPMPAPRAIATREDILEVLSLSRNHLKNYMFHLADTYLTESSWNEYIKEEEERNAMWDKINGIKSLVARIDEIRSKEGLPQEQDFEIPPWVKRYGT